MPNDAFWMMKLCWITGIDYLSVAAADDVISAHLAFLKSREIILVEGLKLDEISLGIYTIHCLPLSPFNDSDSSHESPLAPKAMASSKDAAYPSGYGDDPGICLGSSGEPKPSRTEIYEGGEIFDITHQFTPNTPSGVSDEGAGEILRLLMSMKNGSDYNLSELRLCVHAGTHVDAPGHMYQNYFDQGFDVDTLDLRVLNGPALVVDVPRDKNLTAEVMKSLNIPRGVKRVLFRTLNTDRRLMWKKGFDTSYVGFMEDGAQWLVDNTDIKLVGIDYLSVAAYDDLITAHLVFHKSREIILVEGLKLEGIELGIYGVHCLPLRQPAMSFLAWNCRGLGNSATEQFLKDLVHLKKPVVLFLMETLLPKSRMVALKMRLGFSGLFAVDCSGHSGGLALLWWDQTMVSIASYSSNHIDATITIAGHPSQWRFTENIIDEVNLRVVVNKTGNKIGEGRWKAERGYKHGPRLLLLPQLYSWWGVKAGMEAIKGELPLTLYSERKICLSGNRIGKMNEMSEIKLTDLTDFENTQKLVLVVNCVAGFELMNNVKHGGSCQHRRQKTQNEAFAFGEEFPVEMILQAQAARDVIEKRQRRHRIHPPFQSGQHQELHFLRGAGEHGFPRLLQPRRDRRRRRVESSTACLPGSTGQPGYEESTETPRNSNGCPFLWRKGREAPHLPSTNPDPTRTEQGNPNPLSSESQKPRTRTLRCPKLPPIVLPRSKEHQTTLMANGHPSSSSKKRRM
nr:cyclase-like protein 2 isoform X2 [Ipomoea batatas]